MSYSDGEARILTLLQGMAQFDHDNTSRGNWKVLNSGKSDRYAIVRPGPFTLEYTFGLGHRQGVTTWRTVVEVWQRWKDDGATAIALQELTQAVIEHLEQYPDLDQLAGVPYAALAGGSEMQERWLGEGGPSWAVWEVYVDWQEEHSITPA